MCSEMGISRWCLCGETRVLPTVVVLMIRCATVSARAFVLLLISAKYRLGGIVTCYVLVSVA